MSNQISVNYRLFILSIFFIFYPCFIFSHEKKKKKNGDGITVFLQRYNRNTPALRKKFIELNKGKLGKNNTLILGVTYTLPPLENELSSKKRDKTQGTEPLFGKQYASYKIVSNKLEGASFYLVSGHGGPDPGAIGTMNGHQLHEDEYAYDIILRLARNLLMNGAKVHIIIQDAKDGIRNQLYLNNSKRETCMGKAIPIGQVARLKQRCDKINSLASADKSNYKRAIFIHVDSRGKQKRTDVFFYHSKNSLSKRLAKQMKSTFSHKYDTHQPGRGFRGTVGYRGLYVIEHTQIPLTFVELGNIQNSFDQQRLIHHNNRQALANWLCEGIIKDYTKK